MKIKLYKIFQAIATLSLLLVSQPAPASAATVSIVAGTNGPNCTDGGHYSPSSVTLDSGDKITFSVPADDQYYGGMEIHGFPQGNFVVPRGGSVTTQAITASVNYTGSWPSSSCPKGGGSVTVKTTSVPSSPPSSGGSTGTTSHTSTSTKSSIPATEPNKPSTTDTTTSPSTQPSTTPRIDNPSTSATPDTATNSQPENNQPTTTTATTNAGTPGLKNVATFGGGGLAVLLVGAFFAWRMIIRRHPRMPAEQPATMQPIQPEQQPTPDIPENPTTQNPADSQDDNR